MVITLAVVGAALAVATAAGYLAARGRNASKKTEPALPKTKRPAPGKPKASQPSEPSPFDGLPLGLGDVVSAQGEERWLCGVLLAKEGDKIVGALFLAPEGAQTKAVYVFAPPKRDILWLSPIQVAASGEPPATLEMESALMTRRARFPVAIERMGQGTPSIGSSALWALYEGTTGRAAIVIADGPAVFAYWGERLEPSQYDRMGSSRIDEDDE